MLNKILIGLIVVVAVGGGIFYLNQDKPMESQDTTQTPQPAPAPMPTPEPPPMTPPSATPEKAIVIFETSEGNFEVTLDGKAAPKTVENFLKHVRSGYYEGTKFHRIIDTFMIQGGDPNSKDNDPENDGLGGPGYTVAAEIGLKHNKGAISMARIGDAQNPTKASSGSQFFIVLEESQQNHQSLDGQYTVFGYVTSGMSVVTKIGQTPVEPNLFGSEVSVPLKDVVVNKIIIK